MVIPIKSPVEVKSMIDAVKLVRLVKEAEIKLYGKQKTPDEVIRQRVEKNIKEFCTLPIRKGSQLSLDI